VEISHFLTCLQAFQLGARVEISQFLVCLHAFSLLAREEILQFVAHLHALHLLARVEISQGKSIKFTEHFDCCFDWQQYRSIAAIFSLDLPQYVRFCFHLSCRTLGVHFIDLLDMLCILYFIPSVGTHNIYPLSIHNMASYGKRNCLGVTGFFGKILIGQKGRQGRKECSSNFVRPLAD